MVKMVKTKLNGQFEIILPEHRAQRPEWYTPLGWEKKRLSHMNKHVGKGDIVVYIGAEEGEMPALCQMWGAKVVLVEPNDKVWPNIKAIWEANKLDLPLEVYAGFCAAENSKNFVEGRYGMWDGDQPVENWPPSAAGKIIGDHGFKELKDPGDIPQIKVDTIPVIPTVISLDVEGSEFEVLKGARLTLENYKPKIYLSLHPEFLREQYGEWGAELRKWIMDFGYKETLLDYPLHEVHLFYEPKK